MRHKWSLGQVQPIYHIHLKASPRVSNQISHQYGGSRARQFLQGVLPSTVISFPI